MIEMFFFGFLSLFFVFFISSQFQNNYLMTKCEAVAEQVASQDCCYFELISISSCCLR